MTSEEAKQFIIANEKNLYMKTTDVKETGYCKISYVSFTNEIFWYFESKHGNKQTVDIYSIFKEYEDGIYSGIEYNTGFVNGTGAIVIKNIETEKVIDDFWENIDTVYEQEERKGNE
jgi:hypothetical protein